MTYAFSKAIESPQKVLRALLGQESPNALARAAVEKSGRPRPLHGRTP
jgi:hypothetical protein